MMFTKQREQREPERTSAALGGAIWEILGSYVNDPIGQRRLRRLHAAECGTEAELYEECLGPATAEAPRGIVVEDTKTFRCLTRLIQPKDLVVEIGCSYGFCTDYVVKYNKDPKRVVGVDVSEECMEGFRKRLPDVKALRCNVMREWRDLLWAVEELRANAEPDTPLVVMCDINGTRELESLIALLPFLLIRLRPKLLLVKAEKLYRAVQRLGALNEPEWLALHERGRQAVLDRREWEEERHRFRPQQAPLRHVPGTDMPICRFHNYDTRVGCLKWSTDPAINRCEFDHTICHACLKPGHRAWECRDEDREMNLVETLFKINKSADDEEAGKPADADADADADATADDATVDTAADATVEDAADAVEALAIDAKAVAADAPIVDAEA